MKAKVDKNQNSKCRLCGNRNKTVDPIISECSKLVQKHDWDTQCKGLKIDDATEWYAHKPAYVLENEAHKILYDFEIQTDHLIPTLRPDLELINKEKRLNNKVNFAIPADHRGTIKESKI